MEDREIRAALDLHWAASDANDFEVEHQIDPRGTPVLEYPADRASASAAGAMFRASRFAQPSREALRGAARIPLALPTPWVAGFVLTYDGQPSYSVSIMELKDGKSDPAETQYFGDAFEPGPFTRSMGRADAVKMRNGVR